MTETKGRALLRPLSLDMQTSMTICFFNQPTEIGKNRAPMNTYTSVILSGIVYLLIPVLQRSLALTRLLIASLMNSLDKLAFTLADKAANED